MHHPSEHLAHLRSAGHVRRVCVGARTGIADRGDYLLHVFILAHAIDDDVGAGAPGRNREGAAEPARAAGDQCFFCPRGAGGPES